VREALAVLSGAGLVVSESQRGFRVAELSISDLQDLTEARIKIETLLLRESLEFGDSAWEADLIAAHHRLKQIPISVPGEPPTLNPEWIPMHAEFHETLLAACNPAGAAGSSGT